LSPLSEILIKPEKSRTYFRLILILYLFTYFLIIKSSLYILIKLILIIAITVQMRTQLKLQNPCSSIKELNFGNNKWTIIDQKNRCQSFDSAQILIHNHLFQLVKLTNQNKRKLLILFNDQLPTQQLRFLHLKNRE